MYSGAPGRIVAVPGAPEVSVVIPTLNRWALLRAALERVLTQEAVDLEVVVVDDGSTDETPRRLAEMAESRLVVHRHERPHGVAQARNAGMRLAGGEWLAFLDDDDLWSPRKLRLQLEAAEKAGATMAYGASLVLDEHYRPMGIDPPPPAEGLLQDLLRHNSIPGGCSNVIAKRRLVQDSGGFDESLRQVADWDLWIRLAEGGPAAKVEEVVVAYLDHPSGMHVKEAHVAPAELAYLQNKHSDLIEAHDAQMGGGAWFYCWVAAGQHRAGHRIAAARTYLRGARRYRSRGALARAGIGLVSGRLVQRDTLDPLRPADGLPPWAQLPQ